MKREVQTVVDKAYIEAIVEKAYKGKGSIIVYDNAANNARIERGRYIIGKHQPKDLEKLKDIFYRLIMRHQAFEYDGTRFSYYNGKWRIEN